MRIEKYYPIPDPARHAVSLIKLPQGSCYTRALCHHGKAHSHQTNIRRRESNVNNTNQNSSVSIKWSRRMHRPLHLAPRRQRCRYGNKNRNAPGNRYPQRPHFNRRCSILSRLFGQQPLNHAKFSLPESALHNAHQFTQSQPT